MIIWCSVTEPLCREFSDVRMGSRPLPKRRISSSVEPNESQIASCAAKRKPEAVHQLIHQINDVLENNGKTDVFLPADDAAENIKGDLS